MVLRQINKSGLASEIWEDSDDFNVFWMPKLTNRFRKIDRAFTDIPGLIKEERITFRLEKVYPGGSRL
jgi:hypothetical protein